MAMLVTLCWGAVSGGFRIYKTKTTRWEVVKISASPKRPFFFFLDLMSFFPFSEHFKSKQGKLFFRRPKWEGHVPEMSPPRSICLYVKVIILPIFN